MTEKAQGAPLLRPLITTKGLQAAVEASTLGKAVKIVQVGLTATPGEAKPEDTTLPGAVMVPVADGRLVNDHQVNVSALLPDTFESMGICGIAFYLEDGTMFATYREPEPFLEHTAGTTLLVGMDLVMDNIPSESVIVESTGANLILGDWVPVERTVNGKELTKDITLTATDVGALDSKTGGTVEGGVVVRAAAGLQVRDATGNFGLRVVESSGSVYLQGGKTDADETSQKLRLTGWMGKPLSFLQFVVAEGSAPFVNIGGRDYRMYHQGNLDIDTLKGVPNTRKVNGQQLNADVTLTAEDVKAVSTSGGRMTGKLTIYGSGGQLDLVENDQEPEKVWRVEAQGGNMSMVESGVAARLTLKAGGGAVVSGELEVSANVSAATAPTAGKHLTNKTYVDKVGTDIGEAMKKYLRLAGDTMKGRITAAIMKSSILLKDKASVAFQDGAGSVLHLFANGNALRIAHGNNGENRMLDIGQVSIESAVPIYANAGLVAQSPDKAKWMSMEVPTSGNPFIASRATGEAAATQAMVFGKDNISCMKKVISNAAQIRNDAGLEFSPNDDRSGTTWGIGINPNDRTFSVHKYVDAAWTALPFWIDETGVVGMNTLKVKGGADVEYMQVRNAGNPSVELHDPGNTAAMMYKPNGTARLRFCQSNGAGGEAKAYAEIGETGVKSFNKFTSDWNNNRSWGSLGHCMFSGVEILTYSGGLFGAVGQRFHLPGVYGIEMFSGYQTMGNASDCAHIFAATDGATYTQAWSLRNSGQMESPSGWHIAPNGDLWSPRLGSTVVDWAVANLANVNHIHNASQGNGSMVQGRHSEVGTYMMAAFNPAAGGQCNPGTQVAGAHLYPAACGEWSQNRGWALPGTWMCCGFVDANDDDRWDDRSTLWFRVA